MCPETFISASAASNTDGDGTVTSDTTIHRKSGLMAQGSCKPVSPLLSVAIMIRYSLQEQTGLSPC